MKKRTDGRYQYRITVNGKQKSFYGKTQKEARDKADAYQNKQHGSNLFCDVADEWYESHTNNVKYNTQSCYLAPYKDCKAYFEDMAVEDIKASDIVDFLNKVKQKGYATHTIQLRQIALNLILDYACRKDYVQVNVSRLVSAPKSHTTQRQELTQEQIKKVLNSDFLLPKLILYTGLRKAEALALATDDITDDGYITVNKEVVYKSNTPVVVHTTKTQSGNRLVPIPKELAQTLKSNTSGYIFSPDGSKPFSRRNYNTYWNKFTDYMGEHITAHQLRHSFSTQMFYAGVDVKTAAAIMGHSKVDMMLNRYTHLRNKQLDEAKDKVTSMYNNL